MSKEPSPWMRKLMIALICVIVLPVVLITGWGLKWTWGIRQHDTHVKACFARFKRNTPEKWAAVAKACQDYWMAAMEPDTSQALQPSLPPLLAKLEPVNYDVRRDGLSLAWTGGFDDDTLLLEYDLTEGNRTLWLISTMDDLGEKSVWSELNPPPESRDQR
jgi:hypothetical protein